MTALIAALAVALHLATLPVAPRLPGARVLAWSTVATAEATAVHVDPYLVLAIVEHESRGIADVVSPHRLGCIGLMQICPMTLTACKASLDATACVAERQRLRGGAYNIRVGTRRLAAWRDHCRRTTGHGEARHILSGYGGFDGHGVSCGQRRVDGQWRDAPMSKGVRDIMDIAAVLRQVKR